jgi:hypothetical protein
MLPVRRRSKVRNLDFTSCASLFRRLGASLEFEATNIAAANHALVVDYIGAHEFGHQGKIEVANFRIALGKTVKHTIYRLDRR